ncbi:MFS transporter [Verminephrobacter aporrectodeae subsp. tuberculatae]|uniref:MFS transporter n=1 Tax=Verminephrobacter aporrectodeae subsp. tuberculatae TaxID=1110392 RepID=A0ABT3KXK0_9BURK|nr:MFS transporter [Verminephrobacter aporrectodeae]MCW5323058.1 MFS transporter [Verminephrobacter aporrectodeae subsp. tuberculatae]
MRSPYRWHQFVFGLLGLALAAPSVYLVLGLPLLMRQQGWSGTGIGLFQLAGLPAVFKVVLALPVERWHPARQPYSRWTLLLGIAYLIVLLVLAAVGVETPKAVLFALMHACSVLATWADIPMNALAIKMLPASERLFAGGVRSAALFAAVILGGGAMLLLEQTLGWAAPFLAMSALLLLALALIGSLKEADAGNLAGESLSPSPILGGFFHQPGAWSWVVLLLAYFPFVATAWIYLKPLLLDQGFPASQVAWIAGIGGGCLGALSSLATARIVSRETLPHTLPLSALGNFLVLSLLAGVVWQAAGPVWLITTTCLLAIAMGVTSSLAFSLMMDFSRQYHQAVDYGIQASLFALGRTAVPPVAGVLLDIYRYPGMLLALALAAFVVLLLTTGTQRFVVAQCVQERAVE